MQHYGNIDWSEDNWKGFMIRQRKYLWRKDTVAKLAKWMKMKQGMTVVDVGCGLGYLGKLYWPHFGRGGRYFGVDNSLKLILEAKKDAKEWEKRGEARFVLGDAYLLPFFDNFADIVMCHCLLMHVADPFVVMAEMTRITKPSGSVVCMEPDNLSKTLASGFASLPALNLQDRFLFYKIFILANLGRIKLGWGDDSIGNKLPMIMKNIGLKDIDVRLNDKSELVIPPYEGEVQQFWRKTVLEELDKEEQGFKREHLRQSFFAGGGHPEEFEHFDNIVREIRSILRRQIEENVYFNCSAGLFYISKGTKPVHFESPVKDYHFHFS